MSKTVIFDLGGVVFDWNPKYLFREYFDNDADMEAFFKESDFYDFNARCDAGSYAEMLANTTDKTPQHMMLWTAYRDHYLKSIKGQLQGTIEVIEDLKAQKVPLYALTNWARDTFAMTIAEYPNLKTLFKDILVSGREGILKPDPKIYEMALSRWNLKAEETIFIDDSLKNVEGANRVGIHGVLFTSPEALASTLKSLGLVGS